MEKGFLDFLQVVFWISIIGTVLFIISLIVSIIRKSFSDNIDIGIKTVLGLFLALVLCFVFYRYNSEFVKSVKDIEWYILFLSGFVFSILVFPIITRVNLRNKAIVSSFFCFILAFGLAFSSLLVLNSGEITEDNKSTFIPLGFFVGASLYMILDSKFSFAKLFKNSKKSEKEGAGVSGVKKDAGDIINEIVENRWKHGEPSE